MFCLAIRLFLMLSTYAQLRRKVFKLHVHSILDDVSMMEQKSMADCCLARHSAVVAVCVFSCIQSTRDFNNSSNNNKRGERKLLKCMRRFRRDFFSVQFPHIHFSLSKFSLSLSSISSVGCIVTVARSCTIETENVRNRKSAHIAVQ
jgi:hypothetical protein